MHAALDCKLLFFFFVNILYWSQATTRLLIILWKHNSWRGQSALCEVCVMLLCNGFFRRVANSLPQKCSRRLFTCLQPLFAAWGRSLLKPSESSSGLESRWWILKRRLQWKWFRFIWRETQQRCPKHDVLKEKQPFHILGDIFGYQCTCHYGLFLSSSSLISRLLFKPVHLPPDDGSESLTGRSSSPFVSSSFHRDTPMPPSLSVRSSDWAGIRCSRSRAAQSLTRCWPHLRSEHPCPITCSSFRMAGGGSLVLSSCCDSPLSVTSLFSFEAESKEAVCWCGSCSADASVFSSARLSSTGRKRWSSCCPTSLTKRRTSLPSSVSSRSFSLCLRPEDQRMYLVL